MKTTAFARIDLVSLRAFKRCWLGLLLFLCAMAIRMAAAVWVEAGYHTYSGVGWIPVWVDGHWVVVQHVEGHWEPQTVEGYWEDQWVDGHNENVWVDGYWEDQWNDGHWEDQWNDGYWEDQWNDGYWEDQWNDGYEDEEGNWNDGYWSSNWVDGYWSSNWVDGYWSSNWVDGYWSSNWVDGHWEDQWVDGYWTPVWIPETTQDVWVDAYDISEWVDGGWTLGWGPWTVTVWEEAHWEGPWVWTAFDTPLGDWSYSTWSPDPATVLEGVIFQQSRTASRQHRTGETNEAGEERNVETSTQTAGPFYQDATGTKPFTWMPFDDPGPWYYSAWSPDPATVPSGQVFQQSRTAYRDHRVGERNELGAERNVTTPTETGETSYQNAVGTGGGGGGGPASYTLTVVNGTGGAAGLSAGATRTITATVPAGAIFTGWEISGPGTIPVSRLAVVRTLTVGAGNVTATATYQYPGTQPIWFDVNDDGIRDEVAPRGVLGFNYAIDDIWTTYEYESDNWDIFFDWRDLWWPGGFSIDNFPNLWLNYRPLQITSATTWIASSGVFDGEVGEQYLIMGWNNGAGYWGDYGNISLGAGDNLHPTIFLPSFPAGDFLAFNFVRARLGTPIGSLFVNASTSVGIGGVMSVTLPVTGGTTLSLSVKNILNKTLQNGPRIVWEVWDAINNVKIGNSTLGDVFDLQITNSGQFRVVAQLDDRTGVSFTFDAQRPPSPQFVKLWETKNKANQIYNPTPKDDPVDSTFSANGAPRNKLFMVIDPTPPADTYRATLQITAPSDSITRIIAAVYFFNPDTGSLEKVPSSDVRAAIDGTCNLVFYPPFNYGVIRQDYSLKVGYDANNNGTLDPAEAQFLVITTSTGQSVGNAIIHGISAEAYSSALQAINLGILGSDTFFINKPHSARFVRIFRDGDPSALELQYQPSLPPQSVSIDAFNLGSPISIDNFAEWLTHNSGASFNDVGVAPLKGYTWLEDKSVATLVATARETKDVIHDYYYGTVRPIAEAYLNSHPTETEFWFPTDPTQWQPMTSAYVNQSSLPGKTFLTGVPGVTVDYHHDPLNGDPDDLAPLLGRGRLLVHEVRYRVSRSGSSYSVGPVLSRGQVSDLYDFNIMQVFPAYEAAILQIGYGKGAYGIPRERGKIYRHTILFSHTHNALP